MDARVIQIGCHHLECVPINNCSIAAFRNLRIIKHSFIPRDLCNKQSRCCESTLDVGPCDMSVDWCGWKSARGWKRIKYQELDRDYHDHGAAGSGDNDDDDDDDGNDESDPGDSNGRGR